MVSEASYLAVIHKQLERQEKQDRERNEIECQKEEQKKIKEECEQWKEARKKEEKKEIQHHNRVNKSFEKIPRFDGTNPGWLTQVEALVNDNKGRNYREELLFNCGISVTKMIQAVPQGASHQEIKDAVLRNHLDLRTPHRDPMPTKIYTRSQMKHYRHTIKDTQPTLVLHIQN